MEISVERQSEFREHGYSAYEFEYGAGESPPAIGVTIVGYLHGYGCARNFSVVSVCASRRLINTYIVLLKLVDELPEKRITL